MKGIGFFVSFFTAVLTGCAPLQDSQGHELRLVSAAPSITEILFALGLKKDIVGVSLHCNYPPEAQTKAKIGTFSRPNVEKIIDLKPDIVFVTGLEQSYLRAELKRLGINTVTVYPKTVDELYEAIRYIGELTKTEDRATLLISAMKNKINHIKGLVSRIPHGSRKKILIEIADNPLIVAGKGSFVGQLGTIAGGVNIAFDTKRKYSKFSPELVIERNPDCIILGYMFNARGAVENVRSRLGWSGINAVKNSAIFNDINPDILLRPGPRTPQAVECIYERLYDH